MKRITLLFMLSLALTFPASAIGWKEEAVLEFGKIFDVITAKKIGRGVPNIGLYSTMFGICAGYAASSGAPIPDSAIEESAQIHNQLLRGEDLTPKVIQDFGLSCLTAMEDEFIRRGFTEQEVDQVMSTTMQAMMRQINQMLTFIQNQ